MIDRIYKNIERIGDPTLRRMADVAARTLFENWLFVLMLVLLWWSPHIVADLTGSEVMPDNFRKAGASANWQSVMAQALIIACLTMSYNLLFGFNGVISFGHALFFGAGAYATFIMLQHYDPAYLPRTLIGVNIGILVLAVLTRLPGRQLVILFASSLAIILALMPIDFGLGFYQAVGLAVLVSIALSLLSGAVTLRLKGVYFAMFTLALAEMFFVIAKSGAFVDYTGAEDGLLVSRLIPEQFNVVQKPFRGDQRGMPLENRLYTFHVTVVFFVVVFLAIRRYLNSPVGRVILAVRENEERARTIGYNTFFYKLATMTFAGVIASLSGVLFVIWDSFRQVRPEYLSLNYTVEPLLYTLIGGVGTLTGPVIAAVGLVLGESYLRDEPVTFKLLGLITVWQAFVLLYFVVLGLIFRIARRKYIMPWFNNRTQSVDYEEPQEHEPNPVMDVIQRFNLLAWVEVFIVPAIIALLVADHLVDTSDYTVAELWDLLLGTLFVLAVMVLPNGIVGTWNKWLAERRIRRLQRQLKPEAPAVEREDYPPVGEPELDATGKKPARLGLAALVTAIAGVIGAITGRLWGKR
jgi:branched-chain amino acid transport system permease protein